jgi:hypothetical protein
VLDEPLPNHFTTLSDWDVPGVLQDTVDGEVTEGISSGSVELDGADAA